MSSGLTAGDADGLRQLADRNERAARTAEATASATADDDTVRLLAELSESCTETARLAGLIAGRAEEGL
jgi:hypothetical protein